MNSGEAVANRSMNPLVDDRIVVVSLSTLKSILYSNPFRWPSSVLDSESWLRRDHKKSAIVLVRRSQLFVCQKRVSQNLSFDELVNSKIDDSGMVI